jgi:hypothetical protein
MCNYITVPEFLDSEFYCHFASCCATSGEALSGYVEDLITTSQDLFNSFLGWDLCMQSRTDIIRGDDSHSYFTHFIPVNPTGSVDITYRRIDHYNGYYSNVGVVTGVVTNAYLVDYRDGMIRLPLGFSHNADYTVNYEAGYEVIPRDIKRAMCMMVLNLHQRLDNMQLTNPDFSMDSVRVDKTIGTQFGSSRLLKQVVVKDIRGLNDLPIIIQNVLNRYKYNSSI